MDLMAVPGGSGARGEHDTRSVRMACHHFFGEDTTVPNGVRLAYWGTIEIMEKKMETTI